MHEKGKSSNSHALLYSTVFNLWQVPIATFVISIHTSQYSQNKLKEGEEQYQGEENSVVGLHGKERRSKNRGKMKRRSNDRRRNGKQEDGPRKSDWPWSLLSTLSNLALVFLPATSPHQPSLHPQASRPWYSEYWIQKACLSDSGWLLKVWTRYDSLQIVTYNCIANHLSYRLLT